MLFYVDTREKKLNQEEATAIGFVQKGEMFPTETIRLVVRSSGL